MVREAHVAEFLVILQDSESEKLDFPLVEVGNQAPGQRPGAPKIPKIHGFCMKINDFEQNDGIFSFVEGDGGRKSVPRGCRVGICGYICILSTFRWFDGGRARNFW